MTLVARQSFSAIYDGQPVAVHRGVSRVSDDHELARRFPLRFEPVHLREDARVRFRHALDQADSYAEYRAMLDLFTDRLKEVEQRGEVRVSRV